jgi:two-component system, NarL family, response regulator YdfI
VSARLRGDPIARISVVAYCRDAAELGSLADLVRASAQLELEQATDSLTGLAETLLQVGRAVIVARLQSLDAELPALLACSEGMSLVLLLEDERRVALQALRLGAHAVLGLEAGSASLAAAVASVSHGLLALPAGVVPPGEPHAAWVSPPEPLTPRELEILGLLAGGDSNKTIAARLSISVHTVKFHISSILAKLGVSSRTEAVALGLRLGIVLL